MKKIDRLKIANDFIKIISDHGRRFFYWKGKVGYLKIKNNRVYYVSESSDKEVCFSQSIHRIARKFSHGGTLMSLVVALRDYINGKDQLPLNHIGPWPKYLCNGDLWGYGKYEMQKVRDEITELTKQAQP